LKKTRTRRITAPDSPPPRLFNREFSWLAFNRRVLAEAQDPSVPLLERVKFISIASNNLDEFLMVRLGAVHELITRGIRDYSADGLTPKQQLRGIRQRTKRLLTDMYESLHKLQGPLRKAGIRIERFEALSKKRQQAMRAWFEQHVAPVLTPLAVDPGHPFPFLGSRSLNLAIVLVSPNGTSTHVAFIRVPPTLPRFVQVDDKLHFLPLEELIVANLGYFFPGLTLRTAVPLRVIRNADLTLDEDEVQDLLKSVESELRRRERKDVIWMEVAEGADAEVLSLIAEELGVTTDDIFFTPGLPKLSDLMEIYAASAKPSLIDPPFNPRIPAQLATSDDIFSIVRRGDVLLHRPYDSFTPVVELVQTAADDPGVVAIKQTLYRTDTGSAIVEALARAAERGKQVTAIVELQARFDEMKNITWAKRLEEAGVQVVYGLVGIKTHCKVCLVVRREGDTLRQYVHLSTGNYNARTATLYTDLDLMTVDPDIADDAAHVMNLLTGYSISTVQELFDERASGWEWQKLVAAPLDYHGWVLRMIAREAEHARAGRPAQIIAKMNALVEPGVIEALYEASNAGVKIDLIIRGICCLVPGVAGQSANIRVISVVDRFLEHTRIFLFRNGGATEVFSSSGDWMPRNLFRRVELTFPILAPPLVDRVEREILGTCLADNVKAWKLLPDGSYRKRTPRGTPLRSQERFIEIARAESVRVGPYEESLARPAAVRKKAKRAKRKK
jgi:polyphosphate kinase